jgi:hypothetical protein
MLSPATTRRDSTSVPEEMAPVPIILAELETPVDGLKIAVVPHLNEGADASVRKGLSSRHWTSISRWGPRSSNRNAAL